MKIQPYIEKLENSQEYRQFTQQHKGAFLIAGFFVLDFETGNNLHQIDYYIPKEKKVAAFTLDDEVMVQLMQLMDSRVPEKLDIKTNTDIDALKGIVEDGMKNRSYTEEIKKMIAIIQNIEGKKIWNVNCVLSGMEILKAHVDDKSQTILKMEKASVMDYIKKMPAPMGMPKGKQPTKDELEKEIQQLDKIKAALQKEKLDPEKRK